MKMYQQDFPYEEIRKPSGDLWTSAREAMDDGWDEDQVWSVADDGETTWCYGPASHYVNVIGFVATNERHDGETYYEESWED